MSSLPPEPTLRAARRWCDLLRVAEFAAARALILADASFTDLTLTQYGLGFDLLVALGLVTKDGVLDARAMSVGEREAVLELAREVVLASEPAWLGAVEDLVDEAADLPADALAMGSGLGLTDDEVWAAVRATSAKFDAANRARVGLAGELALRDLLVGAGIAVDHVSLLSDALGYDLSASCAEGEWHIEVKTTTSRAELTLHLSRNEYETSIRDPRWVLVAVAIDETDAILGTGCVDASVLQDLAPVDRASGGRWESARLRIPSGAVQEGLSFLLDRTAAADLKLPRPDQPRVWWLATRNERSIRRP